MLPGGTCDNVNVKNVQTTCSPLPAGTEKDSRAKSGRGNCRFRSYLLIPTRSKSTSDFSDRLVVRHDCDAEVFTRRPRRSHASLSLVHSSSASFAILVHPHMLAPGSRIDEERVENPDVLSGASIRMIRPRVSHPGCRTRVLKRVFDGLQAA